jgi:hypothetical protein
MKIPVLLKPGREDPFTPLRIVQAMIQAGFPKEAFGFYPTTHEGGDTLLTTCGRGIAFGNDTTLKKYSAFPSISGPRHRPIQNPHRRGHDRPLARVPRRHRAIHLRQRRPLLHQHLRHPRPAPPRRTRQRPRRRTRENPAPPARPSRRLLCGFANPALADGIDALITAHLKDPGATDLTALHRDTPRKVGAFDQTYLQPTLISCSDKDHALANTEFMFPYASIVEIPQAEMLANIGQTLVVSAFTEDPRFIEQLLLSPDIERLNLGTYPTNRVQWEQPHEGNLFEFLYHRRAIQGNVAVGFQVGNSNHAFEHSEMANTHSNHTFS